MTTRRSVLAGGATLTLLAPFARLAAAQSKPDSRFIGTTTTTRVTRCR